MTKPPLNTHIEWDGSETPPVPPPELLRKLLRYEPDTGKLFWRARPVGMFATDSIANAWNARYADQEAFTAKIGNGYRQGRVLGKHNRAHRVIWAMAYDEWPTGQIDHINGDPSDNRIVNLRAVSHAENARNTKRRSDNASGVTGVSRHKVSGKWIAQMQHEGRYIHLGYFTDFSKAVAARQSAEIEYGFHENHGRRDRFTNGIAEIVSQERV